MKELTVRFEGKVSMMYDGSDKSEHIESLIRSALEDAGLCIAGKENSFVITSISTRRDR